MQEIFCSGRVTPLLGCFSEVEKLIENTSFKFTEIDAVLIDSGCSSMQFDDGARGFSISRNGPLDMRMDGKRLEKSLVAFMMEIITKCLLANNFH